MNKKLYFTQLSSRSLLLMYALALALLSSLAAFGLNQQAHAATGVSCSYSANGTTYSGKLVDLSGVNFCDSGSDQATIKAVSDTLCTKENYKTTANGCVSRDGKSCEPGSYTDSGGGCWLAKSATSQTKDSSMSSAASSVASSAITGAASSAIANAQKAACNRTGDVGKELNSYLDACGNNQQIRLTKAKADKGEKVPAIILVHGGGWYSDDGNFSPAFQSRMAKWGFTTMRIKYRLMPGGVQEQLWDVQRAIRHVRENADKYGIDKNRIAVWGDSAGGSLAVRAGATGVTGVKAAVGWSAPTNAFRDLFNSYDGWLAGLYHSRCMGGQLPAYTTEAINAFGRGGVAAVFDTVSKNTTLTPQQATSLLNKSLALANTSLTALDDSGTLKKSDSGLGYTITSLTPDTAATSEDTTARTAKLAADLSKLTPSELAAIGVSIYQFTRTAQGITTQDEATNQTISVITNAANLVTKAQQLNANKSSADSTGSSNTNADAIVSEVFAAAGINKETVTSLAAVGAQASELAAEGVTTLGINPQILSAGQLASCMDDFVALSPALYASPRSPRMYLVSGAQERWVNPTDTYQMRDKLRSMGIGADALVLPQTTKKIYRSNADGHMGYDQRAEVPTLTWLHNLLKSKTDSQRAEEARKKAEAAAAKQQAASQQAGSSASQSSGSSSSSSGGGGSDYSPGNCPQGYVISSGGGCRVADRSSTPSTDGTLNAGNCPQGTVIDSGGGCRQIRH